MGNPAANDNLSDSMTEDGLRTEEALRAVLADALDKGVPLDELVGTMSICLADLLLNVTTLESASTACDSIHLRMKDYVSSIFHNTGDDGQRQALRVAARP